MFRVACIQLNSQDNITFNIQQASSLIREAHNQGAELILTPENTTLMADPQTPTGTLPRFGMEDHPAVIAFCSLAKELGVWLVIGSVAVTVPESNKLANRTVVISPLGMVLNIYDKIHLFDVTLPNGETYNESSRCISGDKLALCELPFGKLGLSICYDVRFPTLYRTLAKAGAEFLSIPAAFTQVTGEAHWHVLVRARAIENGCYVFAPAQTGTHPGGRKTYGHSLIVSPWGEILADGGKEPGIITADIDPAKVAEIRKKIPSLQHDRKFR